MPTRTLIRGARRHGALRGGRCQGEREQAGR
jgi:hypothetical protein